MNKINFWCNVLFSWIVGILMNGLVVWGGYNLFVVSFQWPTISYGQAIALYLVAQVLFNQKSSEPPKK